jgi:hypothetical protein
VDDIGRFSETLHALDASFGALGRKILLFVDNCATHSPDTSNLRNVNVFFTPWTAPVSYSLLIWVWSSSASSRCTGSS